MVRVEMLNQHEGHPGAIGQRAQKLPAGIKAAGRSADADNEEVRVLRRRTLHWRGALLRWATFSQHTVPFLGRGGTAGQDVTTTLLDADALAESQ